MVSLDIDVDATAASSAPDFLIVKVDDDGALTISLRSFSGQDASFYT